MIVPLEDFRLHLYTEGIELECVDGIWQSTTGVTHEDLCVLAAKVASKHFCMTHAPVYYAVNGNEYVKGVAF